MNSCKKLKYVQGDTSNEEHLLFLAKVGCTTLFIKP